MAADQAPFNEFYLLKELYMAINGSVFGQTAMSASIADVSDISGIVKVVESIPEVSPHYDIVQLIKPQEGYIEGHFYMYSEIQDGSWGWVDISDRIPTGQQTGYGHYLIAGNRMFLIWADPAGTASDTWIRSEVWSRNTGVDDGTDGEDMLLNSDIPNQYSADGTYITIEEAEIQNRRFFLKSYFESGAVTEVELTALPRNLASMIASWQSDWLQTNRENIAYIRNKPLLIRKAEISPSGELLIYTDDKSVKDLLEIDDDGNLILKDVESYNLGKVRTATSPYKALPAGTTRSNLLNRINALNVLIGGSAEIDPDVPNKSTAKISKIDDTADWTEATIIGKLNEIVDKVNEFLSLN